MSRRKASGAGGTGGRIVGVVLLIALLAGGWYVLHRARPAGGDSKPASVPVATSVPLALDPERVDPANDGRRVSLRGTLSGGRRVRDPELGIEADGLALLRRVEMRQWQERCSGDACDYALVWSELPIDSNAFREAKGHENPVKFPFASKTLVSTDVRVGVFHVERGVVEAVVAAASADAYPVKMSQLPPNLAATLHEHDGFFYTGDAPDRAAAGDLRIGYRLVASTQATIDGVQSGKLIRTAREH